MWKTEAHFEVAVEERLEFNFKLEDIYKKRGFMFEVERTSINHMAFMQFDSLSMNARFVCGSYWYEETNILPIIAMTHELGHFLDLRDNYNLNNRKYRDSGDRVIETRAWLYAVELCKEMNFTRWDVFIGYCETCLGSYFKTWFETRPSDPNFQEAMKMIKRKIESF